MNLQFILEVLDQSTSMDKLNWFESSCVAFASNRKEILENLKRHSQNNSEATKKEKSKLFMIEIAISTAGHFNRM